MVAGFRLFVVVVFGGGGGAAVLTSSSSRTGRLWSECCSERACGFPSFPLSGSFCLPPLLLRPVGP